MPNHILTNLTTNIVAQYKNINTILPDEDE